MNAKNHKKVYSGKLSGLSLDSWWNDCCHSLSGSVRWWIVWGVGFVDVEEWLDSLVMLFGDGEVGMIGMDRIRWWGCLVLVISVEVTFSVLGCPSGLPCCNASCVPVFVAYGWSSWHLFASKVWSFLIHWWGNGCNSFLVVLSGDGDRVVGFNDGDRWWWGAHCLMLLLVLICCGRVLMWLSWVCLINWCSLVVVGWFWLDSCVLALFEWRYLSWRSGSACWEFVHF